MNPRTVHERARRLNSRRAASPTRKQDAHASEEPYRPMQDRVPAERDSSSPDEHDLIWLHGALMKSGMDSGAAKRVQRTRRLWWRVQRRVWCFGYTQRVGIGRALRARVGCNVIATDKRHTSRAGSFMIGGKGRPDTRQKIGVSSSPR